MFYLFQDTITLLPDICNICAKSKFICSSTTTSPPSKQPPQQSQQPPQQQQGQGQPEKIFQKKKRNFMNQKQFHNTERKI